MAAFDEYVKKIEQGEYDETDSSGKKGIWRLIEQTDESARNGPLTEQEQDGLFLKYFEWQRKALAQFGTE